MSKNPCFPPWKPDPSPPSSYDSPLSHRSSNPFSSCGPLENEFLQFYSELHKSAVLFSDPLFQERLLWGCGQGAPSGSLLRAWSWENPKNVTVIRNLNTAKANGGSRASLSPKPPKKQRVLKTAKRRLSSTNGNGVDDVEKSSTSTDGSTAESGTRKDFDDFGQIISSTPLSHHIQGPVLKGSANGKLKRRVSFSKNSPKCRSRSNSNSQRQVGPDDIPWITIQEQTCWSSDMDESDTTETDTETEATARSSGGVILEGSTSNADDESTPLMHEFQCTLNLEDEDKKVANEEPGDKMESNA